MKSLYKTTYLPIKNEHRLEEMAQINLQGSDKGCPHNRYYAYVRGEQSDGNKYPHFHIYDKSTKADLRFLPDGTYHSVKRSGSAKQSDIDAMIVAAKNLVKKNKVNGVSMPLYVTTLWYAQNAPDPTKGIDD